MEKPVTVSFLPCTRHDDKKNVTDITVIKKINDQQLSPLSKQRAFRLQELNLNFSPQSLANKRRRRGVSLRLL